jgi:transcriptional antiterminator NusG
VITARGDSENYKPGDRVTITEGPFEDFDAVVDEVPTNQGLVRIMLNIFGQQVPIKVEYRQIRKAE